MWSSEVRRRTRYRMLRCTGAVGLVSLVALIPGVATGDDEEYRGLNKRVRLSVGTYVADIKTDAAVGFGSALGTLIRVEDDLDLDDDDRTIFLSGEYNFNERHAISFAGFALERSGSSIIDEQIEFEDTLFDVGAVVDTDFDSGLFRAAWIYTPIRTERAKAGFIVSLSIYEFDLRLEGEAVVDDGMGGMTTEFTQVEEDILAPVPGLGMYVDYAITKKLLLRASAEWIDLEFGDFEGKVSATSVGLEWNFHKNLGIGFSGTGTEIEVRDTGDDPYLIDFDQSGVTLHLIGSF